MEKDTLTTIKVDPKDIISKVVDGTSYGSTMVTKNKVVSAMPKPKEYMDVVFDMNKNKDLINLIPTITITADGCVKGIEVRADIIVAGTIPAKDLMLVKHEKDTLGHTAITTVQLQFLEPDDIMEEFKTQKEVDDSIIVGVMRIVSDNPNTGLTMKFDIPVRMNRDLKFDWYPIIGVPEKFYEFFSNKSPESVHLLNSLIKIRDSGIIIWYATQLALLNPVIKERVHRTTIPAPESVDKPKNNKNKKSPKRYIKRITIDDISDIEIGKTKKSHSISEPFWWVSGHMRNQKTKEGHKLIFIEGYWKGPLREQADKLYSVPRQRELVINDTTEEK